MRIVLDLQTCQLSGEKNYEGAYLRRLVMALLPHEKEHEIYLLLNASLETAADQVRAEFAGLVPPERIRMFEPPPSEGAAGMLAAAQLREAVVALLQPDVVHVVLPAAIEHATLFVPPLFSDPSVATSATLCGIPSDALMEGPAGGFMLQALKRAELLLPSAPEVAVSLERLVHIPAERIMQLPVEEPGQGVEQSIALILKAWQELAASAGSRGCLKPGRRPSLAFLSPLPPQQSGISDYSAELLPELSRYYDITLISDQEEIAPQWLSPLFPVRTVDWFERHGDLFDRILYHVGNSRFHSHMFGLLARHPGTVVLHDVFISGIIDGLGAAAGDPDALLRTAYRDHGLPALRHEKSAGRAAVIEAYPCSLHVIQRAAGVIVHSGFARSILTTSYGDRVAPLLHQVPFMRLPLRLPKRDEARQRLGLAPDDHIVCSFGFLGPIKLNHRLLDAWLASSLSRSPRCRLIFVGSNNQGAYGDELLKKIELAQGPSIIAITGFTELDVYRDYLAAADVAVQLRVNSCGETSAAVYDCLAAGLPLVCNAHGSLAELPDESVIKLPDSFNDSRLQRTLEQLFSNPGQRNAYGRKGMDYLRQHHHPARVGADYFQTMERFAATTPRSHERHLLKNLPANSTPAQKAGIAAAIVANRQPCGLRQLLIDISAIARHDLKTGIERVVRSILQQLMESPPPGYRVEPVYCNDRGGYNYARKFILRTVGLDEHLLEDEPVEAGAGDFFIGADLMFEAIPTLEGCLRRWRTRGVRIAFIVYDLLPIHRPDCFPPRVEPACRAWLRTVSATADNLVCISRAVADDLVEHLRHDPPQTRHQLKTGYFHLGADIRASIPTAGLLPDMERFLLKISAIPAFLMVSTIEPRKGHAQALDAFELLWREGVDAALVIVGKPGWMTEKLIERLNGHPELDQRLFCLYSISDEALERVYGSCTALLAPSEGEGFGLPLIEAAQHGLPLIVRDIPVFREVAGDHAAYFSGAAPVDLAASIRVWLALPVSERPSSAGLPWLTWRQSVQQLLVELDLPVPDDFSGEGNKQNYF